MLPLSAVMDIVSADSVFAMPHLTATLPGLVKIECPFLGPEISIVKLCSESGVWSIIPDVTSPFSWIWPIEMDPFSLPYLIPL